MPIYRGTTEYTDSIQVGDGPVWQVWLENDLVWPPYGRVFAFDDGQQLLNIPVTDPSSATVVQDTSTATTNPPRGLINNGGTLYAVKGDLIINPTQAQVWKYDQLGTGEQIGLLPDSGTADIDAAGAMAWDPDNNHVYIVDRVSQFSSSIFRTAGTGSGGLFDDSMGTTRLVFPATQSPITTIAEHINGAAVLGDKVYFIDADGEVWVGDTGEATLTLTSDGSIPDTAPAIVGLTSLHGWLIGVGDTDKLWRWAPGNPAGAIEIDSTIPNVDGEIECLAYVPRDEISSDDGFSISRFSATGTVRMLARVEVTLSGSLFTYRNMIGTVSEGSLVIDGTSMTVTVLSVRDRGSDSARRIVMEATGGTDSLFADVFVSPLMLTFLALQDDGTVDMMTVAAPAPRGGGGYIQWRVSDSALARADYDIWRNVAGGDSIMVAIHEGTASFDTS